MLSVVLHSSQLPFLWPCHMAHGILVPQPETEARASAVKAPASGLPSNSQFLPFENGKNSKRRFTGRLQDPKIQFVAASLAPSSGQDLGSSDIWPKGLGIFLQHVSWLRAGRISGFVWPLDDLQGSLSSAVQQNYL